MPDSLDNGLCPPPDQLEALAAGATLDRAVVRHVEVCPACAEALREIRHNDSFLMGNRDSIAGIIDSRPERPAPSAPIVPGYTILGEVARGGQGVILRAVQEATKRKVAVKMSLAGAFATSRERHRLHREIEIVAALRHPNIVTLFDSGTTPDGRDFVAMEYIHGMPLDRYCRDRLGPKGRAERDRIRDIAALFAKVAKAVQHAHGRGVIHRDLKPGNILVDDAGEPHILDFGLARPLIRGPGATRTVTNEFLGTPAYASPEQVQGDPERIDARSDVYALGVMLYIAITGEPPYPVHGPLPEVLRHVTTTEPSRPSIACPAIPGDAATIMLHALAKDPDRRYQSAGQLATDLEDFLANRPISARRDSAWYVFRKTATRYRGVVFAAGAVMATLVVGICGFAWEASRAASQRDAAIAARQSERNERKRAEATTRFIQNLLEYSDPNQGGKQDIKVSEAMLKGIQELDAGAYRDQPETEAGLRLTIATILIGNAGASQALPLAMRALDIYKQVHAGDHPDVAAAMSSVGTALHSLDRTADAESYYRRAMEMRKRLFPGDNADVATSTFDLAGVLRGLNQPQEAERLFGESLAMRKRLFPAGHPDIADSLNNLAILFLDQHRNTEAEGLFREAYAMFERLSPGDNPDKATVLNNIGYCLEQQKRAAEAEPMYQDGLKMFHRLFPSGQPRVANCAKNLARCLGELGRMDDALALADQAVQMARRTCPPGDGTLAKCEDVLAQLKLKQAAQARGSGGG